MVFKPKIDDRYSKEDVVSHSGESIDAIPINKANEIYDYIDNKVQVVGIDEVQFFDEEVVNVAVDLANKGIRVIAAGLDMDSLVKMTVNVEMPKAIVATTGTISETNKNIATFDVKISKNQTLFATTNSNVTLETAKAKYKADNTISKPSVKKLKANKVSKKAKKATATLKFSKVSGAKKYQVQYSTKGSFKGAKTKTIKKTTYKLTKLKKGTKYYVRVRAVKYNMSKDTVYSKWTKKKAVKTKK